MKRISIRRVTIVIAAAACLSVPATAQARYSLPDAFRTDTAQPGSRIAGESKSASAYGGHGDNPADHPGMSRALENDGPTTIEVVRPERTIVRDVDEALPLILSSTALMLVLAGIGVALVRTRIAPRPGRSH
jgi:hypothetical protein